MCAINGTTEKNTELIERMNKRTKHRGPDGSRVWEGEGVTLGHNRLAIIDLREVASQPMKSADGRYVIVFNGEIYNYRELRAGLSGQYTFTTESDTEVLLVAYSIWGEGMFSKLRGIFAFGIWDMKEGTLLLARDHMGVKPLYYRIHDGVLTFSSEMSGVLESVEKRVLGHDALSFYLSMEYVPSPLTPIEGVMKLPPASMLHFKDGAHSVTSFRDALPKKRSVRNEEVYDALDTAVARQLVSDRPVGAYLSGGFDSSLVVHHMAKHSSHVRTYSVDFEAVRGQEDDSSKFNVDAELARKTAVFYGTEHKTFTISLGDIERDFESIIANTSEPNANPTAITQFFLSDFVRKDGTIVVLGGDGGDELFGGYPRHRITLGASLYQLMPQVLQKGFGMIHPRIAKLGTPMGTALHRALMVKDEKKLLPFLKAPLPINADTTTFFDEKYRDVVKEGRHPLDVFMEVDRETWLPDECFIRSDYASMAHGIELRVPIVDIDVVHLSDEIFVWKKTLPHEGKRIIRHAYKKYLPPHLYGQPKRGWLSPAAKWFRDPNINAFAREVFSSGYYDGLDGLFDWDEVQALLSDHVDKRGYYLFPLWNILVLQIWAKEQRAMFEK
ncbi:MAG: asparagine synthase (glutamine-hydrolyzing) [Candidatus Kaiserbacteria bacterium]|nr:asparagine synthase (glutamine-hydrolyzing) [Candidatus Kaiserbacteria bacterium]